VTDRRTTIKWMLAPAASMPLPNHRAAAAPATGLLPAATEALLRFEKYFAELDEARQRAICDDICYEPNAAAKFARAANFFARYRDLTVGGYHSTPAGHRDLGYIGNVPLPRFDGPPAELLRKLGLGPEPA
jgi:hypothetical protein